MSKGSVSKKKNSTPEKGIRKMRKKNNNTGFAGYNCAGRFKRAVRCVAGSGIAVSDVPCKPVKRFV
jgi:hypothetical protein